MAQRLIAVLLVAVMALALIPVGGAAQAQEGQERIDPLLAGLASFVVPGLGQYLNGEPGKALAHLIIAAAIPLVCDLVTYYTFPFYYPRYRLCAVIYLGWAAYSAIDAYQTAKRKGAPLPFIP